MLNPFPGVNPYVESRSVWHDFHPRVLARCSDELNDLLPDDYAAAIDEEIRLINAADDQDPGKYLPDVVISREERPETSIRLPSGVATIEPTTMTIAMQPSVEIRERWIEIIRLSDESVVTVIELLSPTNKDARGRDEYFQKRRKILESPAHLVEINLLVRGTRPPMSTKRPWPAGEYYALISKAAERPDCQAYGWSVRQPIPAIPIPLAEPDPDVLLDLGAIVTRVYDHSRYDRRMHYEQPLNLPLDPEDIAWAQGLVAPTPNP